MNPYLQRLYDAAGGAATAVEARPAQRSSSPLLAVDQRLASPAYAASFLLGLPGVDRTPTPRPPPEPDLLTLPEPGTPGPDPRPRRRPRPGPGAPSASIRRPPRPSARASRVVARAAGRVADPEPATRPPATAPERDPSRCRRRPRRPTPANRPCRHRSSVETRPVVEIARRARPAAPPVVGRAAAVRRVVEPLRPAAARPSPRRCRSRRRGPSRSVHAPDAATAPPLLRPAPAAVDRAPAAATRARAAEPADLADQVRRLVREAMAGDGTPRRTSRDRQAGPGRGAGHHRVAGAHGRGDVGHRAARPAGARHHALRPAAEVTTCPHRTSTRSPKRSRGWSSRSWSACWAAPT